MNRHTQQVLALAGVAQAAFLAHQLAQHGMVAQEKLDTSINSLFVMNPKSSEEVYGNVGRLNLGLQVLQEIFQAGAGFLKNPDVIRYILGLLTLERKLSSRKKMLDSISMSLDIIENNYSEKHYAANPDVINQLSTIYQNSISTLGFRIQIKGDMKFLQNYETAAKIRAVLFSGIRSAVLWQQLGGRRWHLLFLRKRISRDIILLLSNVPGHL